MELLAAAVWDPKQGRVVYVRLLLVGRSELLQVGEDIAAARRVAASRPHQGVVAEDAFFASAARVVDAALPWPLQIVNAAPAAAAAGAAGGVPFRGRRARLLLGLAPSALAFAPRSPRAAGTRADFSLSSGKMSCSVQSFK